MDNSCHIAIDASNIQNGGGLTHLSQLLNSYKPENGDINKITIWASRNTADNLPDRPWIIKKNNLWLEKNLLFRFFWQQILLSIEIKNEQCNILFSPGGTIPFMVPVPVVCMSQNMLPFEKHKARLFGLFSLMNLKMRLLRFIQGQSLKKSDGIIFLSNYAFESISKSLDKKFENSCIIPHGVESRFFQQPRNQIPLSSFSKENPFRLLYVSILMPYKHQCEIALAIKKLHDMGFDIEMKFIGSTWSWYGAKFSALIESLDPNHEFLIWKGMESFDDLHLHYQDCDVFVFGSSCENLPNILIEAMASGLPIVSSRHGPMPEVLGDSGIYFDPLDIDSIITSINLIMNDVDLRTSLSRLSWQRSKLYSWDKTSKESFNFINSFHSKVKIEQ